MNKLLLILLYLITQGCLLTQNYEIGDTLSVVSINGLNLWEKPGEGGNNITLLETGEKIVIVNLKSKL